jgi:hypothetical protein
MIAKTFEHHLNVRKVLSEDSIHKWIVPHLNMGQGVPKLQVLPLALQAQALNLYSMQLDESETICKRGREFVAEPAPCFLLPMIRICYRPVAPVAGQSPSPA